MNDEICYKKGRVTFLEQALPHEIREFTLVHQVITNYLLAIESQDIYVLRKLLSHSAAIDSILSPEGKLLSRKEYNKLVLEADPAHLKDLRCTGLKIERDRGVLSATGIISKQQTSPHGYEYMSFYTFSFIPSGGGLLITKIERLQK